LVLLNAVTALFGCNQALIKTLETDDATAGAMDSTVVMALRFTIASFALGVVITVGRALKGANNDEPAQPAATSNRSGMSMSSFVLGAGELALWLFLGFFAQAEGLKFTQASSGALLGSLTVVVVPLLSMLDGKKISNNLWASVGLAVLGIILFVGPGALDGASGGYGDGLQLASALFFGIQMWRCEKVVRGLNDDEVAEITWLQLVIISVMSWAVLVVQGQGMDGLIDVMAAWPLEQWALVGAMGLVTTAFCLWAETAALREVEAAPAALIYACEPIWGALFAYLWRGETLDGSLTIAGALLLLVASANGAVSSAQQEEENEPAAKPDLLTALPQVIISEIQVPTAQPASAKAGQRSSGGDLTFSLGREGRRKVVISAASSKSDQ
jgi:drug/metabolite transporter (DMT)-like permease